MSGRYTKARFWKCALQVNPASYISYRGQKLELSEDEYNQQLLMICMQEDIKIVGLADHGNVDGVDAIRNLMKENGIVVFPGFEIATSEKAHFVCLFPEETTIDELNRYLGALGLTNVENGIWPTDLGGNDLLAKVNELGGFAYTAHCTDDNGVLFRKLNHVWKSEYLKAAQIPGALDDLKTEETQSYLQILLNKDPQYDRKKSIGIINAKDVAQPDDLRNPKASCLIKMTKPCFKSFKQAFLDPESRVRLNSDVLDKHYTRIEAVKFTGGYLDGVEIEFSEHLNAIIGGRGTGKSTLIECIRYALDIRPVGRNAAKQHDEIVKENLGKEKGRVEVTVRSSAMNGKKFIISRRFGESVNVKDENGKVSTFTPSDLLPRIEIYGQNEIYEIAQDQQGQLTLLNRFLDVENRESDGRLLEIAEKLEKNRSSILDAQIDLSEIEEDVGKLPKLLEEVAQYKELGLEEKLKVVPKLEQEKQIAERSKDDLVQLVSTIETLKEQLPDTVYLSDKTLGNLPHAEELREIRECLDNLRKDLEPLVGQAEGLLRKYEGKIDKLRKKLQSSIKNDEENLAKAFKKIPSYEGRSGREIGTQFQELLKEIERLRPKKTQLGNRKAVLGEYLSNRTSLLAELSEVRAEHSAQLQRALKRMNKKIKGKLKLTVGPEADRTPLLILLQNFNMEGVGLKRLAWTGEAVDFSPIKLSQLIREGADALQSTDWGITPTIANALIKLQPSQIMQIEELELPDTITIELNLSHEGAESYRPLNKLSTGQQCTAILHMLLLENLDPLIMDQPEDNLDNAFIADRIVTELRSAKISRQFLFATHNANIPVFGDAEWIGVLNADENNAQIPGGSQGAIDLPYIQQKAAEILEGGRAAFIQRKEKYGF